MSLKLSNFADEVDGTNWKPVWDAMWAQSLTPGESHEMIADVDFQIESGVDLSGGNDGRFAIYSDPGVKGTIRGTTGMNAFTPVDCQFVLFQGFNFIGKDNSGGIPPVTDDCDCIIGGGYNRILEIRDTFVGGVVADSAMYKNISTDIFRVRGARMGGLGGVGISSANGTEILLEDLEFIDYIGFMGKSYERQAGVVGWISLTSSLTGVGANRNTVILRNITGDEQAGIHIEVENQEYLSANNIRLNNGNSGLFLKNVTNSYVQQLHGGYNAGAKKVLRLTDCGKVIVEQCGWDTGAKVIELNSAETELIVRHSPGMTVQAVENARYELNGYKYYDGKVQIG